MKEYLRIKIDIARTGEIEIKKFCDMSQIDRMVLRPLGCKQDPFNANSFNQQNEHLASANRSSNRSVCAGY